MGIILLLHFLSKWDIKASGGFLRKFPSHLLIGQGFLKLSDRSYFAGNSEKDLFLGNRRFPFQLMKVGSNIKDTAYSYRSIARPMGLYKGMFLNVHDSTSYLFDGVGRIILSGNQSQLEFNRFVKTPPFVNGIAIGNNSYLLQTIQQGERISLIKFRNEKVLFTRFLGTNNYDVFDNDGILAGVPKSSSIIYMFYYHNKFICLDTNLRMKYESKTIDTIGNRKIKSIKIESKRTTTISGSANVINKKVSCNSKWVIIQSSIRADNELKSTFEKNAVLDVYSIKDGGYIFSFYIPMLDKERMIDFKVLGNKLYVLYETYLYQFLLKF